MRSRLATWSCSALLGLALAVGAVPAHAQAAAERYQPTHDATQDVAAAVEQARAGGKRVLVQSQDTSALEQGEAYNREKFIAFLKAYAPARRAAASAPLWPLAIGRLALG